MDEYNQIYINLEKEVKELSYFIAIDEKQINTYSTKISDLILRAASLLESILKHKYASETNETHNINYDDNKLIKSLKIEDKIIFCHWNLYKANKKIFYPFKKNEERITHPFKNVGCSGNQNYSWNNSYQSLRHQFINSICHYGSLYYLFETLAALFCVLELTSEIFSKIEKNENSEWLGWEKRGSGVAICRNYGVLAIETTP